VATRSGTLQNLTVILVGSGTLTPGTGSRTFTLRKNGIATSLVVTITGPAMFSGADGINTVSVNQFDLISLLHTASLPEHDAGCSVSVQIS